MTNLPRFIVLRVSRLVLADSRANGASVIVRYYRGRVLQHGPGQRARDHRLQLVAAEDARRRRPANAPKISLSATELRVQPPPTHVLNPGRRRPDAKTCARRSQTRKRPGLYLLPHRPPVDPEVVHRSTSTIHHCAHAGRPPPREPPDNFGDGARARQAAIAPSPPSKFGEVKRN